VFEDFVSDPLHGVEEIVVLVVIVIVAILAWRFRDRILLVLTGDDRIHGTSLDFVWWLFFRCCGTCTGDWTRCCTRCWPCPRRIRGQNLVEVIGRYFGLTHYTVELKNIVIGDLPWDGPGDFFLQVECEANPPINSSLAQQRLPKVVHFPEIVTLHLRWSHFEQQVTITVRELNILGSTKVCTARFRACDVIDWAHSTDDERTKRVEMRAEDHSLQVDTPPWILLEFDQPRDYRDLDHFHGTPGVVRTATRHTGHYEDSSVSQFKHSYALLDPNGNQMQEPLEEDLEGIHRCKVCALGMSKICTMLTSILVITYLILRGYVYSCNRRYHWLTTAVMLNKTFPISNSAVFRMVSECDDALIGTGTHEGVACRPTLEQVEDVCLAHFPEAQPRPAAFTAAIEQAIGVQVHGVPCAVEVCEHFYGVQKTDLACFLGCTLLVVGALFCRCCAHHMFDGYKTRVMMKRSLELMETRETLRRTKEKSRTSLF